MRYSVLAAALRDGRRCRRAPLAGEGMWVPQQLPEIAGPLKKAGLKLEPEAAGRPHRRPDGRGGVARRLHRQLRVAAGPGGHQPPLRVRRDPAQLHAREEPDQGRLQRRHAGRGSRPPARTRASTRSTRSRTSPREVQAAIAAAPDALARTQRAGERSRSNWSPTCEAEAGFRCRLYSFSGGNTYRLFRNLEIKDVRLVYAPPGAIGNYGGEVDNWMWPRHTGDFSFYRAYVGKDGKPAAFAADNVPYQPEALAEARRQAAGRRRLRDGRRLPGFDQPLRAGRRFRRHRELDLSDHRRPLQEAGGAGRGGGQARIPTSR